MSKPLAIRGIDRGLWIWAFIILSILCLPTLYLFIWSLWGTKTVGLLDSFTFRWYMAVLGNISWWASFAYSIVIAAGAALISSLSTIGYFYFGFWEKGKYQSVAFFLLLSPLFVPAVIYALALRMMFRGWGFSEWSTLIIGNVALLFPVQYFMLESGNEAIREEWIYGGSTLGATHWENIRHILWPNFREPIIWSFVMGFLLAFDEIVIATFIIYSANTTVPKKMWDAVGTTMDPTPAVLGILILIFALAVVRGSAMWAKKLPSTSEWSFSGDSEEGASVWSYLFKTAKLKRDFLFAIIIAIIIRLLLLGHLPFEMVAREFLIDIGLVLLTLPYPLLYELFPYRQFLRTVIIHEGKNQKPTLMLGQFFLARAMKGFDRAMEAAFRDGVVLNGEELDSFCRLCFQEGRGIYHGTDSNAPSEFMRKFAYYLSAQESTLDKEASTGIRILVVALDVLATDYRTKRHEFERFRDWHIRNSIDLFQVEPMEAEQRATDYKLASTDLGIWNNYVVSFIKVPQDQTKIAIELSGTELFKRNRAYFLDLLDRANKIEVNQSGVQCVPVADTEIYKERVNRQWDHQ